MAVAKNKTTITGNSVVEYLKKITDEQRHEDCSKLIDLISAHTGLEPEMWGTSIVGFGRYHYKYDSGREGDAPLTGLSSRSNAISLYLATSFDHKDELLKEFGKYKAGKGCIYFKKLEDININILLSMVTHSVEFIKKHKHA